MYNKTVMDHFRNPRNVGVIEDADAVQGLARSADPGFWVSDAGA